MRIKQFLYENIFLGEIVDFLDVTKKEPYEVGFKNGMRRMSSNVRMMIDECLKDREKYPNLVTEEFMITAIKATLTDKRNVLK